LAVSVTGVAPCDQAVGTLRARVEWGARHGKHFAPLFARAVRGDQRAGTLSGLDDHEGEREARNQPVAAREVARRRTLRYKGPAGPHRPDSKRRQQRLGRLRAPGLLTNLAIKRALSRAHKSMTTDGIQKLSKNQSGTFGGKRVGGLRAVRKLASRERLATYLHSRAGCRIGGRAKAAVE
jgi:hypothetical protein